MNQLKVVQLIHSGFCSAIFLFGLAVFALNQNAVFENPFTADAQPINFIVPAVALFGLIMAPVMFKKTLANTADENIEPKSKIFRYQTAFLIRCAFLEAGALVNIVACIVTHNNFFIIFAAVVLLAMIMARPTKDSVYELLKIQDTDLF